jgi:hypothetical protein
VSNIAPINRGLQVLENGSNFLSGMFLRWLQTVESRLNKAIVTDDNGNIAYGGATIPSDVDTSFLHIFYPYNKVRIIDSGASIYDGINVYVANGAFRRLIVGESSLNRFTHLSSTVNAVFYSTSGPIGVDIAWTQIYNQDGSGNINIKTGSTYTATL